MKKLRITTSVEFENPVPNALRVLIHCPFCKDCFYVNDQERLGHTILYAFSQLRDHIVKVHNMSFPPV